VSETGLSLPIIIVLAVLGVCCLAASIGGVVILMRRRGNDDDNDGRVDNDVMGVGEQQCYPTMSAPSFMSAREEPASSDSYGFFFVPNPCLFSV
jgi:hypothetical protein